MGVTCCMRLDNEKMQKIALKVKEEQARQLEELKSFYKDNKPYMNAKIKTVFQQIIKLGKYDSDVINFNFVNLQKNRIEHLQMLMPYFHNIKTLKLWKTFIGSEGMKVLANEFRHLPTLEILSLEDNSLGQDGCNYLSASLKYLKNLKELWLHINEIGPVGAFELADVLGSVKNLEKLGLDENSMENRGTLKIVDTIRNLRKIKVVGFGYNMIDQESLLMIAEMVCEMELEKIIFSGNSVSGEYQSRILMMLPKTLVIF